MFHACNNVQKNLVHCYLHFFLKRYVDGYKAILYVCVVSASAKAYIMHHFDIMLFSNIPMYRFCTCMYVYC